MSKKSPTIILFDPDDFYATMLSLILDNMGLELSAFAHDLDSSKSLVEKIEKKQVKPDIAIIEGFMGKSESDGEKIAQRLKELVPDLKIIGFSTLETKKWADEQAIKTLKDNNETIILALEKLTGEKFQTSNIKDPSE